MKKHAVFYQPADGGLDECYLCDAEDGAHAVAQFNEAHPDREDFHEMVMAEVEVAPYEA